MEQEKVFWEVIDIFQSEGLLPHVMLIGSWAEYIYQEKILSDFSASLRTTDVDFLYYNLQRPVGRKIHIIKALEDKGFVYSQNRLSGAVKFVKDHVLDIEFLIRTLGSGNEQFREIPSLGIIGTGLREVNMLEPYPLPIKIKDYTIIVPEPEIYVLHKIFISSLRQKPEKQEKDIQSARILISYINKERMYEMFKNLTKKQQKSIRENAESNFIDM
ncbi:MAG: nucleotidyltransferase domain-containing protein [Oscillospiraceae bacterium]|nr:nucleotidyltransferase domain-containing protein [Oscillospiraceae bacterium]